MNGPIDFATINRAALAAFPAVLARILSGGKRVGAELVALNPRRVDRRPGSFKINLKTGRWSDFATGDKGGGPRKPSPVRPVACTNTGNLPDSGTSGHDARR